MPLYHNNVISVSHGSSKNNLAASWYIPVFILTSTFISSVTCVLIFISLRVQRDEQWVGFLSNTSFPVSQDSQRWQHKRSRKKKSVLCERKYPKWRACVLLFILTSLMLSISQFDAFQRLDRCELFKKARWNISPCHLRKELKLLDICLFLLYYMCKYTK